jgi:hypothetical protein
VQQIRSRDTFSSGAATHADHPGGRVNKLDQAASRNNVTD